MGTASYAYNEELMMASIAEYKRDLGSKNLTRAKVDQKPVIPAPAPKVRQCRIVANLVAAALNVSIEGILSEKRDWSLVQAREVIVLVLRRCHNYSLTRLGRLLNRHHTTIVHLERQSANNYHNDQHFRGIVDAIANGNNQNFGPCRANPNKPHNRSIRRAKCADPKCLLLIRATNRYGRCKKHSQRLYSADTRARLARAA